MNRYPLFQFRTFFANFQLCQFKLGPYFNDWVRVEKKTAKSSGWDEIQNLKFLRMQKSLDSIAAIIFRLEMIEFRSIQFGTKTQILQLLRNQMHRTNKKV